MNSIKEKTRAALIISFVALLFATLGFAGGPIAIHSPGVPFVWGLGTFTTLPGGVPYLKDMGNLNPVLATKAQADALTDLSMTEISAVATSIMTLTAAGDIPMDITGANVISYLTVFHGAGIDVVYDVDGSVMAAIGAPGALGIGGFVFTDPVTPEIASGFAIMLGPAIAPGDVGGVFFRIVFTQEVSHAVALHHDQTNGAISFFGDNTAPGGSLAAPICPSIGGIPALADFTAMYPFADISVGGPGAAAASFDHLEDLSTLSRIYPTGTYAATTGTIVGTVFATDGVTPVNGVNVIARNTADPFADVRSAITGDLEFMPGDGFAGQYILTGLTPGANYTLAIDNQGGGAFPQPPPAAFIEEYWNGASESADPAIDDPCDFITISLAAGATFTADVIFNGGSITITVTSSLGNPTFVGPQGTNTFFSYDVTVDNNSSSILNAQIWNTITLPTGEEIGPIQFPTPRQRTFQNITVPAGGSFNQTYAFEFPPAPPPATYILNMKVGIFPNVELDRDTFAMIRSSSPSLAKTGTGGIEDWLPGTVLAEAVVPEEFVLEQNYPNPFNPSTQIRYGLTEDTHVKLSIYNTLGQEVVTLVDELQNTGFQTVSWNGTDNLGQQVSAGVYVYRLVAGNNVQIKKMTFTK